MVESSASAEGAPLLDRDRSSKLPTPVRAIAAFFLYLYICVGKSDGLIGFGALCVGSAVTIAVTLLVGWFGGCATMVLCFASCFCFGAGNAARGKYELASPVLLASLLLVASGILGSHFFADYVKTSSGSSIGNVGDPVTLQELGNATHNLQRAHIYLSEGEVVTQFTGEAKWCKDRIPVVNTCVNRFFCVAPIMAGPDEPSVGPMGKKTHKQSHNATDALREQYIWAWAGVEWTTSCYGVHFKHAPLRKNWEHDYKRGIGFLRNRHWDDAIHNTLKKYRLKAAPEAPMLQWVQDPTANQNWALFMGWFVEVTCVTIYLVVITTYNHCSGTSKSARPEARRFFYGPDDPIWVRYRNRTRSSRAQATSVQDPEEFIHCCDN